MDFGPFGFRALDAKRKTPCSRTLVLLGSGPLTPKEKHHVQIKLGRKSWDDLITWKSLGGGFKYLLFSPLPGEDSHLTSIFFKWVGEKP